MLTVPRHCPKCGRQTEHKVQDLKIPVAQTVPNGTCVDLTGGFYKGGGTIPAPEGHVVNTMPFTKNFICTICGNNLTVIGDDNQMNNGGSDDFALLARGADWKNPGM